MKIVIIDFKKKLLKRCRGVFYFKGLWGLLPYSSIKFQVVWILSSFTDEAKSKNIHANLPE